MNWTINEQGHYVCGDFTIEHLPERNELKPYFLWQKQTKYDMLIYVGNYSTLDAAKHTARVL